MTDKFAGFFEPTGNFTMVPNDALYYMAPLSGAEFKCLMYIVRHTFGFHDKAKAITLDEFANGRKRKDESRIDLGTGLSRSTIIDALAALIEQGYVVRFVDDTDRARVIHTFGLNMHESSEASENQTPVVGNSDAGGPKIEPRSEKETSETNEGKLGARGARNPRALFGALSQVTPGTLRPRGEDERTSWPMHDTSLPDVCKALWRVFSPSNSKLNVSAKQKAQLEESVIPRGSNDSCPSPDMAYHAHPKAFETFLENLHKWMKGKGISINTGNIIKYVRGYDYKGIGWFEHMPPVARTVKQEESGGLLDALKDIIGE